MKKTPKSDIYIKYANHIQTLKTKQRDSKRKPQNLKLVVFSTKTSKIEEQYLQQLKNKTYIYLDFTRKHTILHFIRFHKRIEEGNGFRLEEKKWDYVCPKMKDMKNLP